jgi:hypothetical protein
MSRAWPSARRWEEACPGNVAGKARALTAIGPMTGGWKLWGLRLAFWARRHVGWFRRSRVKKLRELSFIYYARWALIDGLPGGEGGTGTKLDPPYLYFESNFNGGFEEYIDAFAYVIRLEMKVIFGGVRGFVGPTPATPFKRFIRGHDYECEHYYCAYPEATSTDIAQAVSVRDAFKQLPRDAEPEAFARSWRDFLTKAQAWL